MSPSENQLHISLRAPDDFLSGLLCMAFAGIYRRKEGNLDTFPEQSGHWYLVGCSGSAARLTGAEGSFLLESGQAAALSGESPLDILYQGDCTLYILCLRGSVAGDMLRHSEVLGGSIYPNGTAVLEHALQSLQAEAPAAPQLASSLAYQVLTQLYGNGTKAHKNEKQLPPVVETALKILQQEFAFLDGVGDLAERLEVSQEYLTRTFRDHVGMTPGKYLNQVRVEHAKLLLQRGDHNVSFISSACGFTNGNYFARVFREHVGVTPSVYAREHRGLEHLPQPQLDSFYLL